VIHGDLKAVGSLLPHSLICSSFFQSNILVDEHGVACLADFGLSHIKLSTTTLRSASGFATTQATMGTARWAAPEQMTLGTLSKATDVYSFGMTAYEIFTGNAPFAHTLDGLLFMLVVDRKIRPPRPALEDTLTIDDESWAFVENCWKHEPSERPPALEVATCLKTLQAARAPLVPDATPSMQPTPELMPVLNEPYKPPDETVPITPPDTPPAIQPMTFTRDQAIIDNSSDDSDFRMFEPSGYEPGKPLDLGVRSRGRLWQPLTAKQLGGIKWSTSPTLPLSPNKIASSTAKPADLGGDLIDGPGVLVPGRDKPYSESKSINVDLEDDEGKGISFDDSTSPSMTFLEEILEMCDCREVEVTAKYKDLRPLRSYRLVHSILPSLPVIHMYSEDLIPIT
jgi:serine/threonine protein kinase